MRVVGHVEIDGPRGQHVERTRVGCVHVRVIGELDRIGRVGVGDGDGAAAGLRAAADRGEFTAREDARRRGGERRLIGGEFVREGIDRARVGEEFELGPGAIREQIGAALRVPVRGVVGIATAAQFHVRFGAVLGEGISVFLAERGSHTGRFESNGGRVARQTAGFREVRENAGGVDSADGARTQIRVVVG